MDIAVRSLTCRTATGTHMPCRTTQCYLPPDRADISISMPAGFRRHLVGKNLINVCYSTVTEIRFVGRLMIMWTFS